MHLVAHSKMARVMEQNATIKKNRPEKGQHFVTHNFKKTNLYLLPITVLFGCILTGNPNLSKMSLKNTCK